MIAKRYLKEDNWIVKLAKANRLDIMTCVSPKGWMFTDFLLYKIFVIKKLVTPKEELENLKELLEMLDHKP